MKTLPLFTLIIAGGLAACQPSTGSKPNITGDAASTLTLDGKYTMTGDCEAMAGTISVTGTRFRVTETVCEITARNDEGDAQSLTLSSCQAEGTDYPDMRVEFVQIDADTLLVLRDREEITYNRCPA